MYAEVDTCVASSLEAEGLPGSPWLFNFRNNVLKPWQSCLSLLSHTLLLVRHGVLDFIQNVYIIKVKYGVSVQVEGWQASHS